MIYGMHNCPCQSLFKYKEVTSTLDCRPPIVFWLATSLSWSPIISLGRAPTIFPSCREVISVFLTASPPVILIISPTATTCSSRMIPFISARASISIIPSEAPVTVPVVPPEWGPTISIPVIAARGATIPVSIISSRETFIPVAKNGATYYVFSKPNMKDWNHSHEHSHEWC